MDKPEKLLTEHLEYIDDLRESGVTNMYGAGSWLKNEYPDLSKQDSHAILGYWMHTFSDRHKED